MKKGRLLTSMILLAGCCWLMFGSAALAQEKTVDAGIVGVEYRGHIQDIGNFPQDENTWIQSAKPLGTTGECKRIEGFRIRLTGADSLPAGASIRYNVHVENVGWLAATDLSATGTWLADGAFAGSEGRSQRVEAIQIVLTGADGKTLPGYSVEYQVHGQDYGWTQGWQADGAIAGTISQSKRLEAIQIRIVRSAAGAALDAYSALQKTVAGLQSADYTAATWAALQTAITENVADETNTADQIKAATAAIQKAVDGLEKKAAVTVYDAAGTYGPATATQTIAGDVTVAADGVILQNQVIQGNLTISEAVGDGNVTLNNVTVAGDTFVRGGGKNSIHINGGSYHNIVVEKTATGQVRIVSTGAAGRDVVIAEDATGEIVILEGVFDSVAVNAPNMTVTTQGDTKIVKMAVSEQAAGSTLNLGAQTTVNDLDLAAKTAVKGQGSVKQAEVSANGVSYEKAPEQQTVAPAVTVPPVMPVTPTPGGDGGGGYTPPVSVTGITGPADLTVGMKKTGQLTATVTPTNATNKKIDWVSDKPDIATVDASGKVTGINEGIATITATSSADGTKKASCTVTVTYSFNVTKGADGNGTITGINGSAGVITIPAVVDGVPITAIGSGAFDRNTNLTSVTIPNTVTTIGYGAFGQCSNLNTVTFAAGSTLTTIGNGAFAYSGLTTISLPANLSAISDNMFQSCTSLTNITLPVSLTTIGKNAFYDCNNLTGIVIPNGVTAIPDGAFDSCWVLSSVKLPSGLTSIGTHGFQRCKALTSITLPATLGTIGQEAFSGAGAPNDSTDSTLVMTFEGNAPKLLGTTGVHLSKGTTIQYYAGCTGFAGASPWNDTSRYTLKELEVRTITSTAIKGVTIPFNGETPVTAITADPQFTGTVSWTETSGGASVSDNFDGTKAYTATITLKPTNGYTADGVSFAVDGASVSAPVGKADGTFTVTASFPLIEQYHINDDPTSALHGVITGYSGAGEGSFGELTIPEKVGETTVTGIGVKAFDGNTELRTISFPETLKMIDNEAFKNCSNLTTVTFGAGSSLTAIGDRSFNACAKLTDIAIPAQVATIGNYAFAASGLKTITFMGNAPTTIGTDAIPKSNGSTKTTIAYYFGSTGFDAAPWNVSGDYTLKVLDKIVTHTTLTGLTAPSVGATPVTFINDEQYSGSVSWNGGSTDAFSGSRPYSASINLAAQSGYVFPDGFNFNVDGAVVSTGLVLDGKYATVTVGFQLPSSGQYTIDNAGTITAYYGPGGDVPIPDQVGTVPVTGIGAKAFAGNTYLTNITIPATVTTIEAGAFTGCTGLKLMIFRGNAPQVGAAGTAKTATIPTTATIDYYSDKTGFAPADWTGYTLTPILAAPSGVAASSLTSTSVTLGWTGDMDASGYQVYCGTVAENITSLVGKTLGASYDVTGLKAGQTYYFTVTASDDFGSSLPSIPLSVKMPATP